MVEAQTRMETALLIALMIIAAIIGYSIDFVIVLIERNLTKWRFVRQ